jgi:hypothetical protein
MPGAQAQSFFFVNSGSSTREKRAHVMRHHIQEKRKQHLVGNQAERQANRSPRYLPWRKKSGQEDPLVPVTPANGLQRPPGHLWVRLFLHLSSIDLHSFSAVVDNVLVRTAKHAMLSHRCEQTVTDHPVVRFAGKQWIDTAG